MKQETKDLYKQGKRENTKNKRFIEAKQKRERERVMKQETKDV